MEADTPEGCWKEYWEPILWKDGQIDLEQLKKELFDYANIIWWTSEVYTHATGGLIGKPNTDPAVVKAVIDDHVTELCREENASLILRVEALEKRLTVRK